MERLILASSSPRRKEILKTLSIPFVSFSPDLDESIYDALKPEFRVQALAEAKALAVKTAFLAEGRLDVSLSRLRLGIAADTLVVLGSGSSITVIGKPSSLDEARTMLCLLQGKTHRVYSGLCLLDLDTGKRESVVACTTLRFASMTEAEIVRYLDSEEWIGAAGAYRIQGQASYFIESIRGSWSCVMGLPIRELYGILNRAGYEFTPEKGVLKTP